MDTLPTVLAPDHGPLLRVEEAARQPTWQVLGHSLSTWALWATVLVCVLLGLEDDLGPGRLVSGLVLGGLGFALVSLGEGIVSLLWFMLRLALPRMGLKTVASYFGAVSPTMIGRILGVFLLVAGDLLFPNSFFQQLILPAVGELFILLMAVTGILVASMQLQTRPSGKRIFLGAILTLNVAYLFWVFQPGTDAYLARAAAPVVAQQSSLANPGLSGPYEVQTLSYGSGADLHRAEFAGEAALLTEAVDGTSIFAGYSGLGARYFQWYWGFDFSSLPLNGLVWYPVGDGPFPIVLIVHGNHAMTAASDRGYAYLAEHLASHGFIAVSVDENFLNGILFLDGHMQELPLRAWLLLKHLQVWKQWNADPENWFYDKVDLQRVALIGHSRGGEAAPVAAHMNGDGDDFGFGIGAVVAIAPSDGNYRPNSRALTLTQSDYLLLGGGHDADTFTLYGQAQYNRVHFDNNPDGFKALAYIYRANHGQFNTVWGNRDRGSLNSLLLNRKPLLSGEEQKEATRVLVTAFLRAALYDEHGQRALFANPGVGEAWLPNTLVITQYDAAETMPLDAEPSDIAGAASTKREALLLRDGVTSQQNWALYVAWEAGGEAVLEVEPDETSALESFDALTLALTPAQDIDRPVVIRLELALNDGRQAHLSLGDYAPLPALLPARLLKADWLAPLPGYKIDLTSPFERVLQSYTVPLWAFEGDGSAPEAKDVHSVRAFFGGAEGGAMYVDRLGFVAAP